ncbi:phosphotransferase enzyme family protein [Methylomonas sp. MgM2]
MTTKLQQIAAQFTNVGPEHLVITPLGNGLINDTYLVESASSSFVLQRINSNVFSQPKQVVENLARLGRYLRKNADYAQCLRIPDILPTRQGETSYRDQDRQLWRALERIHPAESRNRITHDGEAAQIGLALAGFHRLCSGLSTSDLHDTLPGFHVTPAYLVQYQQLLARPVKVAVDDEFQRCRAFIESRQNDVDILESAKARGELKEHLIHGDPKLNNFLFQPGTDRIVSLIDLDTIKPGLLHYDIADCLRSCCHDRQSNQFDLYRCRIILENYLDKADDFFRAKDYDYLYAAIWLIPFELGLRFFTDYLNGNRYFKTSKPRQNLERALAQFALCDSIERQKTALELFIFNLKDGTRNTAGLT